MIDWKTALVLCTFVLIILYLQEAENFSGIVASFKGVFGG